jgi:hypothetical protein
MPLIYSRISTQEVVITFPVHIPEKNAFASFQDHGDGMIIVGTELVLQLQVMLGLLRQLMCNHENNKN